MSNYKFILSGGGTGGHIYPAIAIADALKVTYPAASFLFVGAQGKMEMQKVPQLGYSIKGLWISGLSRKISMTLLFFPFKLFYSLFQALFILVRFKPHMVIGTGGYASAPLLKMAQIIGVPTLIQEQNSYAGVSNMWLAKKAQAICVAYPNMQQYFPKERLVLTGNPVRSDISELLVDKNVALAAFGLQETQPVLLVLGGSSGAKKINEYIAAQLPYFKEKGLQLLWQCGSLYYEQYKSCQSKNVKVLDYIVEMPLAYSAADLLISRAGAGTISEIMLIGCPAIFIPSPNVAEDHQTKNALAVTEIGAGAMVIEKQLEMEFKPIFEDLLDNQHARQSMKVAMKSAAQPNATAAIVKTIKGLLEIHKANK